MSGSGTPAFGMWPRRRSDHEVEFRKKFARFDRRHKYVGCRLRVEQVAHPDYLYYAYLRLRAEGGAAPGLDRVTYADLSAQEVGDNLREVSRAILAGTYRPGLARLKLIPKATPGQYRLLRIANLTDRAVGKALQIATRPFWEHRLPACCYAYRPRRGTWDAVAAVEVAMRRTGRRVLAISDVMTAFDAVPIGRVIDLHRDALDRARRRLPGYVAADRDRTVELIANVLRGDDPARTTGIDQGGCYSPSALNVLLGYDLDRPLRATSTKPFCARYSDNLAYLVQDVAGGHDVLDQAANLLQPLGMSLKGSDGVHDLSTGASVTLLGYDLRWDDGGLVLRPAARAWAVLREHLQGCYAMPTPSRAALAVVRSWVTAYAPAVTDGDADGVLAIANEYGFREFRPEIVTDAWRPAWGRWELCRARASHRFCPLP